MEERKTIGQIYLDVLEKSPEEHEAEELRREMHKDYEHHIVECVERGKKLFDGTFFVHVETKKERLTPNVIRNYFIPRETCPTPFYDQTVYKYDRKSDMLEFIWVVPAKDICLMYRDDPLNVPPEEKDLLNYILEFYDGTLMHKCKKLNDEE